MNAPFDIYLAGVGGQGIGLLAEVLIRAADHAGLPVRGCDTHGLAQRGGIVSSHIRIGEGAHSPLIMEASAHLVIALERHEAARAAGRYLRRGGTLVWYDACWQPLDVRLGAAPETTVADVDRVCVELHATCARVHTDLPDPRLQNIATVAEVVRRGCAPGITSDSVRAALCDLMDGAALEANLALLR